MSEYWKALEAPGFRESNPDWREDHAAVVLAFAGKAGKGWIRVNCPRCEAKTGKEDKKASLGYNSQTGGYNCFKCGVRGRLSEKEREDLPFTDPGDTEDQLPGKPEDPEPPWGYQPIFEEPALSAAVFNPARDYYLSRGLPAAIGALTGVGSATWGLNRGRVIIPLPDYEVPGKLRGWVGRDFTGTLPPGIPQYRYAKRFTRASYLYNEPVLYEQTDEPVFVVEGTLDAHALWPDAVAVLGKPLEHHVGCLRNALRPVVIVLDGDAHEEGWALAMKLKFLGARAGSIRLPPGKDPDEMPRDWLDYEAQQCLMD